MKKMRILLDKKTLSINNLHQISSKICVQLDGYCFPSASWSDLSASVLAMWLTSVNNYLLGCEDTTTLFFMDGDYSIRLVRRNDQEALVYFTEPNEKSNFVDVVDIQHFGRQLLSASAKVMNHLQASVKNRNIEELSRLSSILRLTLQNLKK